MNVAAVIVTYNRKELLLENLKKILDQKYTINKIVIVDNNSSDNTYEYLKEHEEIDFELLDYIYLKENIGGAGGFYTGVKKCFEDGYDWMILMDDDGRPYDKDTFQKLFDYIRENDLKSSDSVLLNSLVIVNPERLSFGLKGTNSVNDIRKIARNGCIEKDINNFNGTCISRGLVENIGFPNKEFFIKGDEVEYMNRANKANAFVATVVDSLYYHPTVDNTKRLNVFKKSIELGIEKPWKEYYSIRNYAYMYSLDKKYISILKLFIKKNLAVFLCKCHKIKTLKMIFKGVKDGLTHSLGIKVKPN